MGCEKALPFHNLQKPSNMGGLGPSHHPRSPLKPERPLETLGWNLLGKLLLPTVTSNTLQPNKPPCANKTLFRSSCTKQAVKLWLQSCAAGTGLHFLFLSCHLSHTGRQRLQVSSCSNTHFSGTSRLLRNFQNKQLQTGFKARLLEARQNSQATFPNYFPAAKTKLCVFALLRNTFRQHSLQEKLAGKTKCS